RYVVRRTGSDLVNGKRLDTPMRSPGRDVPLIRRLPRTKLVIALDSVKIENIDGIFVPVEGRVRINTVRSNGEEETSVATFKRSEIDLNPDFDKYEGAFVLDVPDGTPVNYVDFFGTGVRYVWQNGKMVADVDDLVIAELDKTAQQIIADGDAPAKLGTFKKTDANDQEPNAVGDTSEKVAESQREVLAESNGLPIVVLILIGLAIIGVVGLLVFRKLKA
ncbi:MAG: hypothetical protein ACYTE3_26850, partial [Planctomycetota bacterium]